MSVCRHLLGIVAEQAKQHQVNRVLRVHIQVGALRGIVPAHLTYYFDFLKKGTVADAAWLDVELVPGEGRCEGCGRRFSLGAGGATCPGCGTREAEVVAGLELRVKSLSVE